MALYSVVQGRFNGYMVWDAAEGAGAVAVRRTRPPLRAKAPRR